MAGTQYWGVGRQGQTQATSFTTTAGTIASTWPDGTTKVRIILTGSAWVRTDGTTASSGDMFVAANVPEYFTISPSQKPSAISSVTGTTAIMFVTAVS